MSFAENFRYELSRKGCSVRDFAHRVNINYETVMSYLDPRAVQPSAENAVKIAKGLGVTVEYLVTGNTPNCSDFVKHCGFVRDLCSLSSDVADAVEHLVSVLSHAQKKASSDVSYKSI